MSSIYRVLHVLADSNKGGGLTHVLQLLGLLGQKTPKTLGLLTNSCQNIEDRSNLSEYSELIEIPFFSLLKFLLNFFRIRTQLLNFRPDIIHCHGGRSVFLIGLLNTKIPLIYTVHGLHFISRTVPSKYLGAAIEYYNFFKANHIIFVSHYDLKQAQNWKLLRTSKHTVIHNGIGEKILSLLPFEASTAQTPSSPSSRCWDIAYVGRLESVKDPILFLKILQELPTARALLIGDGSLSKEIHLSAKYLNLTDRLTLTGSLSHADTLRHMAESAVVIMTSRREGLPLVILEAMTLGIPVIAPSVGGIPELVIDGESGYLIRDRKPQSYARKIKHLLSNPELYASMASKGKARVKELFSEDIMALKTANVYQKILKP